MEVKILTPYMDMELKRTIKVGEIIEVSSSRAKRLVTLELAEFVSKPMAKKATRKAKVKKSK